MSICLIDTSIFVEILAVPGMNARHRDIREELGQKIMANESLFLPMATILETGNHIAQNGDGNQRRKTAMLFVEQIQLALDGKSPFRPILFHDRGDLVKWLGQFPDAALSSRSFGDLSIISDWEKTCAINRNHRVYIWSLDRHLASFDRKI